MVGGDCPSLICSFTSPPLPSPFFPLHQLIAKKWMIDFSAQKGLRFWMPGEVFNELFILQKYLLVLVFLFQRETVNQISWAFLYIQGRSRAASLDNARKMGSWMHWAIPPPIQGWVTERKCSSDCWLAENQFSLALRSLASVSPNPVLLLISLTLSRLLMVSEPLFPQTRMGIIRESSRLV